MSGGVVQSSDQLHVKAQPLMACQCWNRKSPRGLQTTMYRSKARMAKDHSPTIPGREGGFVAWEQALLLLCCLCWHVADNG